MNIVNYQNTNLLGDYLNEFPDDQRKAEGELLAAVLAPHVPTTTLESILKQKREARRILHAPVYGEQVPDGSTGQTDSVARLPGEGSK